MINLHEKKSNEKLDNMLEELFTKAIEQKSKPQKSITYKLTMRAICLKGEGHARLFELVQRICELHEGKAELHVNVEI